MLEFVIILPKGRLGWIALREADATGELGSLGGALFARLTGSVHADVYPSPAFELLPLQKNDAAGRASPSPGEVESSFPSSRLPRLSLRLPCTAFGILFVSVIKARPALIACRSTSWSNGECRSRLAREVHLRPVLCSQAGSLGAGEHFGCT